MQTTLENLLTDAIRAIIGMAEEGGVKTFPTHEYTIQWMEPLTETSSHSKEEVRTEPSYREFKRNFVGQLEQLPEVVELKNKAKEFAEREGKFPFHFPAENFAAMMGGILIDEYFYENKSLIIINSDIIRQLCCNFINILRKRMTFWWGDGIRRDGKAGCTEIGIGGAGGGAAAGCCAA